MKTDWEMPVILLIGTVGVCVLVWLAIFHAELVRRNAMTPVGCVCRCLEPDK